MFDLDAALREMKLSFPPRIHTQSISLFRSELESLIARAQREQAERDAVLAHLSGSDKAAARIRAAQEVKRG